jgi:hypothetical protein
LLKKSRWLGFVTGPDFSRAAIAVESALGFSPCNEPQGNPSRFDTFSASSQLAAMAAQDSKPNHIEGRFMRPSLLHAASFLSLLPSHTSVRKQADRLMIPQLRR